MTRSKFVFKKALIYDDPFTFAPDSLVNIVIINKAAQG